MASFDVFGNATRIAKEEGVDPALFRALIRAESGGDINARSPVGAIGLAQLMPGTAAGLGVDPNDPLQNLRGGARYLAAQIKAFGNPKLALAAYNAGPGAVQKYGGVPPFQETQDYIKRVLGFRDEFPGQGGGASRRSPPERNAPDLMGSLLGPIEAQQEADPRAALLGALGQPGGVTTQDLIRVAMLKRQQTQDQRTSAKMLAQEQGEPGGKKPKPANQSAGPSRKEWGELKGIGNTTPQFMIRAIKQAQDLGLAVRENEYVDPVDPVHVEGSFHHQTFPGQFDGRRVSRALDVSGDPAAMDKFFRWAIRFRPTELFYDPLGQYDNGRYSTAGIGNHSDHVHISV